MSFLLVCFCLLMYYDYTDGSILIFIVVGCFDLNFAVGKSSIKTLNQFNPLVFVSLQPVEATDDAFWDQFWADTATSVQDVFALVPAAEIRAVREESPSNLATLCYKVKGIFLPVLPPL